MEFPVIELVDRYAIAVVKQAKTNGENREEVKFYVGQLINAGIDIGHELLLELINYHSYVWDLEDDFKKCRIDSLPMEEVGKRALHIRDVGFVRQELKNKLAELYNDPVREIKK